MKKEAFLQEGLDLGKNIAGGLRDTIRNAKDFDLKNTLEGANNFVTKSRGSDGAFDAKNITNAALETNTGKQVVDAAIDTGTAGVKDKFLDWGKNNWKSLAGIALPLAILPLLLGRGGRQQNTAQPQINFNLPPSAGTSVSPWNMGDHMSLTKTSGVKSLGNRVADMGIAYVIGNTASRNAINDELDERQELAPARKITTDDKELQKLLQKPAVQAYIQQYVNSKING